MTIDQTSSWTSRGETPSGASGWRKLRMTCLVRACPSDRGHGATPAQDQTPSSQSAPPPPEEVRPGPRQKMWSPTSPTAPVTPLRQQSTRKRRVRKKKYLNILKSETFTYHGADQ